MLVQEHIYDLLVTKSTLENTYIQNVIFAQVYGPLTSDALKTTAVHDFDNIILFKPSSI